jgi:tetratricopeptide (TPR) repeat protein
VRRVALVLALLGACSSPPRPPPEDPTFSRLDHAGDIAFNLEQPDQAVAQYRSALARARTRDDAGAIADAGFNLATAELRAGRPRDAIQTVEELRAELGRRGVVDPEFDLIIATALFRLNDLAASDGVLAGLTAGKPALVNQAWFLRGLIADKRHDRTGLQRAVSALTTAADPADVAELQARLAQSASVALHAASLRRDALDYRGMARALALAGQFTPDAAAAADLYLRAGRSAAAQGNTAEARGWLDAARRRAPDAALRGITEHALRDLPLR